MKKWRKAAALVGVNLLLTVGLMEAALRIVPKVIPANLLIHFEPKLRSKIAAGRFPTADDAIAFNRDDGGFPFPIWKPFSEITYSFQDPGTVNTVKMDENGFCNAPNLYTEQPQFDVIGIGDSFTWCLTVRPEDTWVAQLAQISGLSAYNLGKPAIGLYEYLQLLKRFGLQKSPKVVVMNIYEGNDLRDALKYVSYRQSGATEKKIAEQAETFGPLSRYSYAWNLLRAATARAPVESETLVEGYSEKDENFRYKLNFKSGSLPFNLENGDLDEVVHAKLLADGKVNLSVFSEALTQFMALAKGEGFTPIIAYTPSAYTAYADVAEFEQPILNDIMPAYSQKQRAFFAEQAAALNCEFIDLTPILQAAAPNYTTADKLLYYQTNRHFTKYGHAIVAEALNEMVERESGKREAKQK
jgi:hypothetical protein